MTHTVPRPDDQAEALRPADWAAAWLDRMAAADSRAHAIEADIVGAATVTSLRDAAGAIDELLPRLHADGVRAHLMAKLVQRLHAKLFARLWSLLAPPDLVTRSCLLVMGSEGRGEQTAKTDQDNALLLRDELRRPGLGGCRSPLQRGAGRVRLSALPWRHHGHQPALAPGAAWLSGDAARLAVRCGSGRADASGDLSRCCDGGW